MNSEFALAVHSLILLASDPEKMLTSNDIAKSTSVHPVRVRTVLSVLKKEGFINSREGARGGFLINCNPAKVTLDEIYRITLKDVLKPKCHSCSGSCTVGKNIESVLEGIFLDADVNLQKFLKKYTLATLLKKLKKK